MTQQYSLIVLFEDGYEAPLNRPGTDKIITFNEYTHAAMWATVYDTNANQKHIIANYDSQNLPRPILAYVCTLEHAQKVIAEANVIEKELNDSHET